MHHDFNVRAAQKYWPLQEHEALILLLGLLDNPRNWSEHIRRYLCNHINFVEYLTHLSVFKECGRSHLEYCVWIQCQV